MANVPPNIAWVMYASPLEFISSNNFWFITFPQPSTSFGLSLKQTKANFRGTTNSNIVFCLINDSKYLANSMSLLI
ncbi:hypothetical protein KSS87_015886 [Heliosperma pusillum]|nr:hypothetical protein KSS87_015886 [Heliosperma pusillum]